ncbi:hypothetical protein MHUMG1_09843 [Metarhizium humberi]|uniref:Uncharacterized protein n=1 Tax=Metarhizium humberi TaxID=2596975 RepID=A0A9P8S2J8_9HYPO|nr:hypothetical protein MHUMG1_09843 [Metarhizium humberi]
MLRQNRRRSSPSFGLLSKTATAMLSRLVRRLHLSPTRIKVKDANTNDTNVCQGAMSSIASVQATSDIWRQWPRMACVLDMEPFLKTGQEIPNGVLVALIEHVLPSITLLSATVGEVMALLEGASIEAGFPTGIQGIVALGKKL